MPSDEDVLAALAGDRFVRLGGMDRTRARREAQRRLQELHAAEYRRLLDAEAGRILEARERRGLWG